MTRQDLKKCRLTTDLKYGQHSKMLWAGKHTNDQDNLNYDEHTHTHTQPPTRDEKTTEEGAYLRLLQSTRASQLSNFINTAPICTNTRVRVPYL